MCQPTAHNVHNQCALRLEAQRVNTGIYHALMTEHLIVTLWLKKSCAKDVLEEQI